MIRKKCTGYRYSEKDEEWSVTTDYINENIYLSEPDNDGDICAFLSNHNISKLNHISIITI